MIYFFHLLILVSLLILERNDRPRRKLYRTIIPLLYILIVGLRGTNVGVDSFTYYEHYYTYGKWGCDFIEPGFDWLNRILYAQGYEANSLFITMAAITVLFFYLALNRLDKEYSISAFCVYLLTFAFLVNGMRQGVACAVFLYAYKFIQEKKPIPYILLIAFAGLFHASALILLPLYFVLRYALPSLWYIVLYILSFAGLFIDLSVYIPEIGFGVRDYSGYVENIKFAQASWTGFIISTLLNIGILYLMFSNRGIPIQEPGIQHADHVTYYHLFFMVCFLALSDIAAKESTLPVSQPGVDVRFFNRYKRCYMDQCHLFTGKQTTALYIFLGIKVI